MKDFGYARPASAADAARAGNATNARFIAGGTLLVDLMRLDVEQPDLLVDLNDLGWTAIDSDDEGLSIGALVKNTDLAYHATVHKEYPVLSQALLSGASPQIRNMASVGGNLLQRTRCSYFRDVGVAACNKRAPGSGCAARQGYSRMHAILGGSDQCIAAHPSDMCVALVALGALVRTVGPDASRELPLEQLHTLPGAHPEVEHVLRPGELIRQVHIPKLRARRSAYVKVRDRASYAFALASAAVVLDLDAGRVRGARVALGGVATKPWRSPAAEAALLDQRAERRTFEQAAEAALEGARTTPHNAFKLAIARAAIVRALETAAELA
jgi:xanthine dehydrogenase YagS FAD-binding subunit